MTTYFQVMRKLVLDILNPIAKKHPSVLINAFGIVWISRRKPEVIKPDPNQVVFPKNMS